MNILLKYRNNPEDNETARDTIFIVFFYVPVVVAVPFVVFSVLWHFFLYNLA